MFILKVTREKKSQIDQHIAAGKQKSGRGRIKKYINCIKKLNMFMSIINIFLMDKNQNSTNDASL